MNERKFIILAWAAALCFNNWLLGLVLNSSLMFNGGAVSEFSALDQPHHTVFRVLDVVSGILFIALALLATRKRTKMQSYRWLIYGTALLGAANICDAMEPLACSVTANKSCVVPVQVSLSHLTIPQHAYSSIVIAICYLLLPIAGWFYAKRTKARNFKLISIALAALSLAYLVAAIVEYAATGKFSGRAWGPTQEVQMLLLGAWFIVWARTVTSTDKSL